LFRYDGTRTVRVEGDLTGPIHAFHDTPTGLLVGAEKGLFRYDGTRTVHVVAPATRYGYTRIDQFHDTPRGMLVAAENGLFRYDGTRIVLVEGDYDSGDFYDSFDTQ